MLRTLVSYLAVLLGAASYGLGGVICWSAYKTLRPPKGIHLMFWHVLAVTLGVWGFHALFLVRVISDLNAFDTLSLLPGTVPTWYLTTATTFLALNDTAFWLILKVQRGRRQLQRRAG